MSFSRARIRPKRAAFAIETLRRLARQNSRDPELEPTNRLLKRWAVSQGSGLPEEDWDGDVESRPTPLDPVTAVVVDQIILHSPARPRAFINAWYRGNDGTPQLMQKFQITNRNALYMQLNVYLGYYRGRFEAAGLDVA